MSVLNLHILPESYKSLENESLLIVGNGSSAAQDDLGEDIDNFDRVIRINNYVTQGMESKVGSRTDIWVNGANQGLKKRIPIPNNILVMIPSLVLHHKGDAIHDRIKKRLGTSTYTMLPLAAMQEMEQTCGLERPTTGFFSIYFFYLLGLDITLHGFDFFVGSTSHYFDHPFNRWLKDRGIIKKAAKHDVGAEKTFVEDLLNMGKLKRLKS
ncbi:glycosyltransferase family 29 protein [bacterium]|nr:glycosyltransferase family 29 protein [bacterium]